MQITRIPTWERLAHKLARKGGILLHIPICETKIILEVFAHQGDKEPIKRVEMFSHSWVRNSYNQLFMSAAEVNANYFGATYGVGQLNLKDLSDAVVTGAFGVGIAAGNNMLQDAIGYTRAAGANATTSGILVGSGINAESFEDTKLQTLIANGTGAGQLSYVTSQPYSVTWTLGTLTMKATHIRYMNNNSGGNVSVNEVALTMRGDGSSMAWWLMSRDHLGATVTIPDTGQLKVTYEISLVYPA